MRYNAGCAVAELKDEPTGDAVPLVAMYPADEPERDELLGPYPVSVAPGAPVSAGRFPLVVISHGSGGSHLVYRSLALHLARHGCVVMMPEHPRNNRNNNDLGNTNAILANRPRHVRTVIDHAFTDETFAPRLIPDFAAVAGHSLGGYTALALAGGIPAGIEVTPDPRVKALVLLAPATAWFTAAGALRNVRVPILMLTGGKDSVTSAWHADNVVRGLGAAASLDHRVVPGAGHFSFLTPFPAEMTRPGFAPSQDPEGFDRERFQTSMNAEILTFLKGIQAGFAGEPGN